MKNLVASIQDRLKNFSRMEGVTLNLVLEDYANARLFARLSASRHRDDFILKGAQLFKLWSDTPHRPTRDADFLSFGPAEPEVLKSTFEEICGAATSPPDGLAWTVGQVAPIREDNLYGGVRIKLAAHLGNMRIPAQIDVGFGDAITPEAETAEWKMPLDFPSVPLLVYRPAATIAEKLQAAVELGTANSRMKDFYDLHWLSLHHAFAGKHLQAAVDATFQRRGTDRPQETPVAFTNRFHELPDKQTQWKAFLRKSSLQAPSFEQTIQRISDFLLPVLLDEVSGSHWHPETGWTQGSSLFSKPRGHSRAPEAF